MSLPTDPGVWCVVVGGAEPLHTVAGYIATAASDRLAGDAVPEETVVLVPDAAARRVVVDALLAGAGPVAGAATRAIWTPGTLYREVWEQAPAEVASRAVIVEAGRAVDAAIRSAPEQFPNLANAPPGPTMARAYATLREDIGRAGAHSRSPGTVAALEQLRPDGLGQELLAALGMMEGCLQRVGVPARWEVGAGAAHHLATTPAGWRGPRRLVVVGFDSFEQALIDILRAMAVGTAVTILVPAPGAPAGGGLARALEWLGAAAAPNTPEASVTGAVGDVALVAGPADACDVAASLAAESGLASSVVLVPDPSRWRTLFEEACARRGWFLGGAVGSGPPGWALRFILHAVRAWELGLTAARAVDLVNLGSLLRLGPAANAAPFLEGLTRPRRRRGRRAAAREPWDRLDARLRSRGVRRDHAVIARVGGDVARLVAELFDLLEAPASPAERLLGLASICRDMGFWRRCLTSPALVAGRETSEVAAFAAGAEELARQLDQVWPPSSPPAGGSELLVARVAELVANSRSPKAWRAPPAGSSTLWLQSFAEPLPAAALHVVLVGVTEAAVERAGRSGRVSPLIPDGVRGHSDVSSLVHLPLARDPAIAVQARLRWLLSGGSGSGVDVVLPHRDLGGDELLPWAGLGPDLLAQAERQPPLTRAAMLRSLPLESLPNADVMGSGGVAATIVDAYRACPRRFYYERVLRVRDRDAVEFDIDSRQRGNWLHALMHKLFRDHRRWWREGLAIPELRDLLLGMRLRPRDRLVTGASDPFLRLQRRAIVERAAARLVEHAELLQDQAGPAGRRRQGMAVVGLELSMRGESAISGLVLRGTLDRLDIVYDRRGRPAGMVVVDYKTGRLAPYGLATDDEAQERLQLLLYAHLAERVLGLPCLAAVAVPLLDVGRPRGLVLADPNLPAAEAWVDAADPKDVVDAAAFKSAIEAALAETRRIVQAVGDGHFPAEPANDRECSFCSQSLYCEKVRR